VTAYSLPDLDYDFGALEPHVSGKTVELHHGKHHAAYVQNANLALEQLAEARAADDYSRLPALEKALAFNLSGHVLHSILWKNMTPRPADGPTGELAAALDRDLGGPVKFRRQMSEAAASIMGSGWAALVFEPTARCLLVTQVYDHQANLAQGSVPLMVIDAWEHAYYLQYRNDKKAFFEAIWNVCNWADIGARYDTVRPSV